MLNAVEGALQAMGALYLITPFQLMNNVSFTSNQTQTFTAWGAGGVASGARAIMFGYFFSASVTGVSHQFAPHGSTLGQYFNLGNIQVASAFFNGFGICPLDAVAGKIDVKSSGGASSSSNMWIYGYYM